MHIDLSRDVVLVTGGAGSIGAQIAIEAAGAGAAVAVADRDLAGAEAIAARIAHAGGRAFACELDLTDSGSVERTVGMTTERYGLLTTLANAAGLWRSAPSEQMTDEMWDAMLAVNLTGTFRAARSAVPALKAAGRGSIVNLASVAAFTASGDSAPYSATKAGVIGYTTGLSGELAPHNIRVNAICPGWVDGGFTHQALERAEDPAALRELANGQHLLGRIATPQDVANAAIWLMSDRASFVTGSAIFVDGGYMAKH